MSIEHSATKGLVVDKQHSPVYSASKIRNFCIIAHIDHGKSTLSDRILEITHSVEKRKMEAQILDSLDIERERGITVKSAVVSVNYQARNEEYYTFNLIDTPGHVDFTYEVSRSLAACEGALLIVDAAQGVEAQTLANYYLALDADLDILPVINKVDLPSADVSRVKKQIVSELALDEEDIVCISAKTGLGIEDLLEKIVSFISSPPNPKETVTKALIFDSFFDVYRGAIACIRLFQGKIKSGDKVKLLFDNKIYQTEEVGLLGVSRKAKDALSCGEVGYIILGIKSVSDIKTGDTITDSLDKTIEPLLGYKDIKPMVFAGIYPIVTDDYNQLFSSLEKLKLNDSALQYEKDSSVALGFGFRCGFLGLLHMEIVGERLSREFNINVLITAPSVRYQVIINQKNQKVKNIIDNPSKMPDPSFVVESKEPYIKANIIAPAEYLGSILQLVQEKRGLQKNIQYLDSNRIEGTFELPLAEMVFDFYDKLKSYTKGYASLDYELIDYRLTEIVKVDILVNKEPVDALSFLVHKDKARERGKQIIEKLKEEIHRHMFAIPLQACIGSTIIARENISAIRKDVTAKCYGGDISRKRKLLEKQKEGKKKMKSIGNVDIPQKAFINILKT